MQFDFLDPVSNELIYFVNQLSEQSLGKKIVFHSQKEFPNLELAKIAIIGVLDNRGGNISQEVDLTYIRKELYSLFPGNWSSTIVDLGDITEGNSQNDTYYAVSKVVSELVKKRITPIIIGGSQDITYAMYRGYDNLDQMVNVVSIDNKFDFGKDEPKLTAESFVSKMIINEPNNLYNYSNIGFQTYFNSQEEIDLIEKLHFDAYRLGEISSNPTIAEPIFRDADLVSLDLNSVKSSSSGNNTTFNPNGFNGKEICSLARYAGISDNISTFGIFNHNNSYTESALIAQIIWYFIEGYNFRSFEKPSLNKDNYLKYIVPIDDLELVFYKSPNTERWWIEMPQIINTNNKYKRHALLPCTNDDYLKACDQEIPERWWKAQRKNIV